MRRFAIVASASGSGSGKTTGRELARRLEIRFVERDELNRGPNWIEASADELRARVEPIVAGDAWIVDGGYQGKLLCGRDALIPFALRHFRPRRRLYPARLAPYDVVRLRSPKEVERWLARFG